LDTGILLSILGIVATIIFGIVGPLVIRNRLSQRQKAIGAHSTGIQSGRDTIIIKGPATFNSKTPDANLDELRIAIVLTILLGGLSIFYFWDKTHPIELQQTILLQIAFPAILILLVIVSVLWVVAIYKNTRY
jgi:hypothetical protein